MTLWIASSLRVVLPIHWISHRSFQCSGASVSQGNNIRRLLIGAAAVYALAMLGCAAPVALSQRFYEPDASACTACEDRHGLHGIEPYVAGPFMHRRGATEYMAQQATIQPPHSKFHPVPARPVFETRASYLPPQPMGVELVPVPDQEFRSTMPRSHQPDSLLGPPDTMSEAFDASELDGAGAIILSPPSN